MTSTQQNATFLAWVEAHGSALHKIARAYSPPGAHAELHQDLLIAVWHAVPLYRGQASPLTFLYRTALNCALNWTRAQRRYESRHVELDAGLPAPAESRLSELYAALVTLSATDRSLALLYLDGLSYREIADVLGITETNVGVRLNRLKQTLKERNQ